METLAEAYPKEQARLRKLLEEYRSIGPAGRFGFATINAVLERADRASAEQDTAAMVSCYRDMQRCE